MKQPIKNIIRETHSELVKEPIYTLLIDGTNLLKISFVDPKINSNGEHIGGVFQFLLQVRMLLMKRDWDYVYVFFDDEDSGILRYKIYSDYKANRDKHYDLYTNMSEYEKALNEKIKQMKDYIYNKESKTKKDVDEENFIREREILMKYFNELYIRWMMDKETEGDDLIAYYVLNKKSEEKIVIVSSDEDFTQLLSNDVYIYNPRLKKNITNINFKNEYGYPYTNVLIKKIICGDKSDNIGNILGVSEKKLFSLIPEITEREITIDEVKERAFSLNEERKKNKKKPLKYCENILNSVSSKNYNGNIYEINEKLINLKKPLLTENARIEIESMMYAPQDPENRSFKNLYNFINEDDIIDLKDSSKFTSFFSPFKKIVDKEIKRYSKEVNLT